MESQTRSRWNFAFGASIVAAAFFVCQTFPVLAQAAPAPASPKPVTVVNTSPVPTSIQNTPTVNVGSMPAVNVGNTSPIPVEVLGGITMPSSIAVSNSNTNPVPVAVQGMPQPYQYVFRTFYFAPGVIHGDIWFDIPAGKTLRVKSVHIRRGSVSVDLIVPIFNDPKSDYHWINLGASTIEGRTNLMDGVMDAYRDPSSGRGRLHVELVSGNPDGASIDGVLTGDLY